MIKLIKNNVKKFFIILLALFLFLIVASIAMGSASITMKESFIAIIKGIPFIGDAFSAEVLPSHSVIIYKIRLPRIIMASLTGMGLGVVGVAFQGVFKNPMADPYVLGISSGGALGAAIAIVLKLGESMLSFSLTTIFAFMGALLTAFLVYNIARVGNQLPTVNLLLSGVAVSFMLSACLSLLMVFNRKSMESIVFWTLGSLNSASWRQVVAAAPIIILGTAVIYFYSRDLNIMLTGDEAAKSMGIDVERVKKIIIIVSAFLVAASVAFTGIIGFVGLLIPHMMRMLVGPNHKQLIPFSALGGAIFLLVADTIARSIMPPAELPVGAVTALFGSPYFIFLFLKYKKRAM